VLSVNKEMECINYGKTDACKKCNRNNKECTLYENKVTRMEELQLLYKKINKTW
jgi:hypothetical protein